MYSDGMENEYDLEIKYNKIGTNKYGSHSDSLPNGTGIFLGGGHVYVYRNTISGNRGSGIYCSGNGKDTYIDENIIGWTSDLTHPYGNGASGITIAFAQYYSGLLNHIGNNENSGIYTLGAESQNQFYFFKNYFSGNLNGGIRSQRDLWQELIPQVMYANEDFITGLTEPNAIVELYVKDDVENVQIQGRSFLDSTIADDNGFWYFDHSEDPQDLTLVAYFDDDSHQKVSEFSTAYKDTCSFIESLNLFSDSDNIELTCGANLSISIPENPYLDYDYVLFNGADSISSSSSTTVAQSGSYYYKIINPLYDFCEILTDTIFVETTCVTSIYENDRHQISISPNPVLDLLHVEGIEENSNYHIIDSFGRIISEGSLEESSNIVVQDYPSGVYIIHFDNGLIRSFLKY